jgi:hypothetical protein
MLQHRSLLHIQHGERALTAADWTILQRMFMCSTSRIKVSSSYWLRSVPAITQLLGCIMGCITCDHDRDQPTLANRSQPAFMNSTKRSNKSYPCIPSTECDVRVLPLTGQ